MIKFIDIESGNVFDGQMPYVHWFDEAQSVNLIYSKKLFVISNYRELVIGMPNTGVFDILKTDVVDDFAENLPNLSTYELYDNLYLKIDREEEVRTEIQDNEEVEVDIRKTACADLVDNGTAMQYRSIGTQYRNGRYYIHRFYIIAKSQFAGEYIEEFILMTEDESEVINCKVGADFYNEDERLGINLKNFGMEAPSLVQKAIYEGNVHEEFQDNVLINRKWKELLINYQDCLMCKGSYKSLLNCLEWFGYGDNIKLLEYWRKAYDDGTLFEDNIKDTFYNITKEMLRSNAKTTYIGILLATQKIDSDSDTRYDPYEPIPLVIERENLLYTISDLCLKMTLLGNFFSTYFMPIHLDLIHCSIERLVYSTTIKIIAEGENKRVDFNDSNEELLVEVDSNFKLGDVHIHVYVDPHESGFNSTFAHKIIFYEANIFRYKTVSGNQISNQWFINYAESEQYLDNSGWWNVKLKYDTHTISRSAFLENKDLKKIIIPDCITSIDDYAFDFCSSLTSIVIPNTVTSIGMYAFGFCSSLTSIVIPNSVTFIGIYAFYDCTSLTSIEISNSVTSIGIAVFSHCSNLTSIVIPNSVTSINSYAFNMCPSLTSVTCLATNPPSLGTNNFTASNNDTLYVPSGCRDTYLAVNNWNISFNGNIQEIS